MKATYLLLFLFLSTFLTAQIKMELKPSGFSSVEMASPSRSLEDLIQISKGWATSFTEKKADVYDVSPNSLSIDAIEDNAYFYTNRGEQFSFDVKYTLKIVFQKNNTTKLSFSVKEIYDHGKPLKSTVADFFKPDGTVKEDFSEAKSSLENTAEKIIRSYSNAFID